MTIKVISPEVKKQYFDGNGDPYSGGKLYVYQAGTTTEVTTYTDESGVTPNASPVILNSNGEISGLYLTPGSYKFALYDADDNLVWTVDNVTIRDFGQEIDDIESDIVDLETEIASTVVEKTYINSGKASNKSSRSRFLIPDGATNEATILGDDTDLVYYVDGVAYTLDSDVVVTGLNSAPSSNNTTTISDPVMDDQDYTKQIGSLGHFFAASMSSEMASLDGKIAAFMIGDEYFKAVIDDTNSLLKEISRGYFYDENGDPIEPVTIANGDTITLLKLAYIFLKTDETAIVTYNQPIYSTTEPASPSIGDMWFDQTNKKWMQKESILWVDAECAFIGEVAINSSGEAVGARPTDFIADFDYENTLHLEIDPTDSTIIRTNQSNNRINVYGVSLKYLENSVKWDTDDDFDDGEAYTATGSNYAYIKEDGDVILSILPPFNTYGELKGFYHPYEAWRYVGKLASGRVRNSLENSLINNDGIIEISTDDYTCGIYDRVIFFDNSVANEDRSVYLYPPSLNPGGKVTIKMLRQDNQKKLTVYSGSTEIGVMYSLGGIVEYVSNGSSWEQTSNEVADVLLFSEFQDAGTDGGTFTQDSWEKRLINTIIGQADFGSLDAGVMTLDSGVYLASFFSTGYQVNGHLARLIDTTSDHGNPFWTGNTAFSSTDPTISKSNTFILTLSEQSTFELQHYCKSTKTTNGRGLAISAGGIQELYSEVSFTRIGNY